MTDSRPPHRDYSQPLARTAAGEIDDTQDEGLPRAEEELTPLPEIARAAMRDVRARFQFSPREEHLAEIVIDAVAVRVARRLGVFDRVLLRLADLEIWRKEMHEYRLKLSGVADGNGRLGKMDRRLDDLAAEQKRDTERVLAEVFVHVNQLRETDDEMSTRIGTAAERQVERATVKAIRWTTIKVLGLLAAASSIAGGGVWATIKARDAIRTAEARASGERSEHEKAQDENINRLFGLCAQSRSVDE